MKALTWHGNHDVRVDTVPDPTIQEPTDAIVKITSTAICGSDLHLYEVLGPYIDPGDILGHEPMGIVEEVGSEVTHIKPGDRVVIPFNVVCGHCWMCERQLYAHCETTQNYEYGTGASFLGYTKLYGHIPGGQAEFLRVPQAQFGPIKVPDGPPDDRFLYLSDVLPTSWQAVEYANIPEGGSVTVFGLGPIGQMSSRIAKHRGYRVIAVDLVPERLRLAEQHGIEIVNLEGQDDIAEKIRDMTDGRGTDSVIDAVGMEAHGSPVGKMAHKIAGFLPDSAARTMIENAGTDRLSALVACIETVRRAGTISISGVYGGTATPMNLLQLFDKGVVITQGQAHVKRWIDDIMPLLEDDSDPLDVEGLATHKIPLDEAPHGYEIFQKKQDGAIKVVLQP
jgi:threonine dehydrogenase-like Zn-dependent dehydrogenase